MTQRKGNEGQHMAWSIGSLGHTGEQHVAQRGDKTRDKTAPGRMAGTRVLGGGARGESQCMEAAQHGSKRASTQPHGSARRLAGGSGWPLMVEHNKARRALA
ncbi:hypothetical protein E2562_031789 [Oryza meyeriana var. granulata]|uniref:Uncharacterized protein n=1 Tax=Oryza meyeriana var. granulata TaxID=110450 RepID=A0A6G1ECW8_9ORYZ|nr:hypothetical protein E2562_031789 [Oryza meyeriana var. granulata]